MRRRRVSFVLRKAISGILAIHLQTIRVAGRLCQYRRGGDKDGFRISLDHILRGRKRRYRKSVHKRMRQYGGTIPLGGPQGDGDLVVGPLHRKVRRP